jgi:hypothetical protein
MPLAGDIIRASDVVAQFCRVTRTVVQSISDNSATAVAFDDELLDTYGMHSTSTNNSRITIAVSGVYDIGFTGSFAAAADYVRTFAELILNGATNIARAGGPGTSNSVPQPVNVTTQYQLDAGDYVEVQVFQDNTANAARNLEVVADRSPQFYVSRVGS